MTLPQMQPHPLRQLELLEERMESASGYTGHTRWMIPYADLLTLLLGFFIVLYAIIEKDLGAAHRAEQKAKIATTQALEQVKKAETRNPSGNLMLATAVPAANSASVQNMEQTLMNRLHINGQQVVVTQDPRGLVISFQDRIFFAPGQADLSAEAQQTLDKLAAVLLQTHHPIRVEGHTDNTPIHTVQFPSNWELSTTRATTIVRALIERHHFPPNQLSAAGYGEYYPLVNNSTIEGKQKNRRVDIVVLNSAQAEQPTESSVQH